MSIKIKLDEIDKKIKKNLGLDGMVAFEYIPNECGSEKLETCFVGAADMAVDIVYNMQGMYFSDVISILGWKYKDQIH